MFSVSNRLVFIQKFLLLLSLIAIFTTALITLSACSREPDSSVTLNISEIAINGYDPVSYFNERKPSRGTEEYVFVWNNTKYQFSCKENLELFKNNPARYAPQHDGYCAFAMSRGDYSRVDPESYAIVNDKLYLTFDRDIRSTWLYDKENYIKKADRIWQESKLKNN